MEMYKDTTYETSTQIGIIVCAIIGFNAANADPLPTSAPEPGPGVKEGNDRSWYCRQSSSMSP